MSLLNHCKKCGNELGQNDIFCQFCGTKVIPDPKPDETIQPPFQTQAFKQTSPQYLHLQHQSQPRKKNSILPVILITVIVLFIVVCTGGYFAYVYLSKNTGEQGSNTDSGKEKQKIEEKIKSEQNTSEISGKTKQEKETLNNTKDLNDVSDVTGDSEADIKHDTKNFPGKYPEGSKIYLDESDLVVYYSKDELKIMRNEIFARHGYIFKTDDLKSYFSKQKWYKPERENVDDLLSIIEKKNVATIKSAESKK